MYSDDCGWWEVLTKCTHGIRSDEPCDECELEIEADEAENREVEPNEFQ